MGAIELGNGLRWLEAERHPRCDGHPRVELERSVAAQRAVQSSPMDGNALRLSNITSRGGGFANFGGRSDGHDMLPSLGQFEG